MLKLIQLALAPLALCGSALAQVPEDSGPYPAGVTSVQFSHPLAAANNVSAEIYYPAETAGTNTPPRLADGPYPLVGFSHGYFAPPQFYSDLCEHIASHGFVVASIGTESGLFQFIDRQAQDTHAMLYWMDEQSVTAGAFFEGMLDDSDWAVVGHSNGCVANMMIPEWEAEVYACAIAMEPRMNDLPALSTYKGALHVIAGSNDLINPPAFHAVPFYEDATSTRRRTYTVIEGAGHNGSINFPSAINPLSHSEQHRLHRRLVVALLQTEVRGREDECYHIFGDGASSEPLTPEAICRQPILWTALTGSELHVGGASVPELRWVVGASLGTTPLSSPQWFPELDPARSRLLTKGLVPATGLVEVTAELPSGGSQDLYIRGGAFSSQSVFWTRMATLQAP